MREFIVVSNSLFAVHSLCLAFEVRSSTLSDRDQAASIISRRAVALANQLQTIKIDPHWLRDNSQTRVSEELNVVAQARARAGGGRTQAPERPLWRATTGPRLSGLFQPGKYFMIKSSLSSTVFKTRAYAKQQTRRRCRQSCSLPGPPPTERRRSPAGSWRISCTRYANKPGEGGTLGSCIHWSWSFSTVSCQRTAGAVRRGVGLAAETDPGCVQTLMHGLSVHRLPVAKHGYLLVRINARSSMRDLRYEPSEVAPKTVAGLQITRGPGVGVPLGISRRDVASRACRPSSLPLPHQSISTHSLTVSRGVSSVSPVSL